MIGTNTAGRKWIKYEIEKSWNDGKGVLGIYVHNLKDSSEKKANKGSNPFMSCSITENGKNLSGIVKTYDPPYSLSTSVYDYIKKNLKDWIEEAISIRENY